MHRYAPLALLVLAGCPTQTYLPGDPPTTEPADLSPEEASAAYVLHIEARTTADCDREQRCDAAPDHASVEDCVADTLQANATVQERIADAIAEQRASYDPVAATDCEAAYRADCDASLVTDILPVCNAVIEGRVADGEACIGHFECAEPPGHEGTGPFCFDGCDAAFGSEEPAVEGSCTLTSPALSDECS